MKTIPAKSVFGARSERVLNAFQMCSQWILHKCIQYVWSAFRIHYPFRAHSERIQHVFIAKVVPFRFESHI